MFARRTDDQLAWRVWRSGTWSDWRSLGGVLTSAPAVASWERGRLDVFVRGAGGALYQRSYDDGAWTAWQRRGGILTSSPAATSWRPGRIDLVARTTGADLVHRVYRAASGWSSWRNLGGALASQPALVSAVDGRLDAFFRANTGRIRVRAFVLGDGWSPATTIGEEATYASGPGALAVGDDVVVAARRADGRIFQVVRRSPTANWSSWTLLDAYRPLRGLGTWVDVYDYAGLAPSTAVADMQAVGVRRLLLCTGRFDSVSDFHDEVAMGRWLDEAHARGIEVVGWYVPAYGDMDRDVRRTAAIGRYVSPGGQRFDAVGVDIERYGAAGEVDLETFNARVATHLRKVRSRTSAVVAAITPSPYATDPGAHWEGFPWAGVGANSEVVVPMALWSFRLNPDGTPFTPQQVHDWVLDQIDRARALTGRRVHVEGGVDDPGTENTPVTQPRVQAFVDAAEDGGAIGGSHYDYVTTAAVLWPILAGLDG